MKRTVKAAIRKALVKKNTLQADWGDFKELAARYNCHDWEISALHKILVEEGKIVFSGARYEWKQDELECYIGSNPKFHFIALLGWSGCQMIVGGGYFIIGFAGLCLFLIKTTLKFTWYLIAGLWSFIKSIYRYFTEQKK